MILSYPSSSQESMRWYLLRVLHLSLRAGDRLDDSKSGLDILVALYFSDTVGEGTATRQGGGMIKMDTKGLVRITWRCPFF